MPRPQENGQIPTVLKKGISLGDPDLSQEAILRSAVTQDSEKSHIRPAHVRVTCRSHLTSVNVNVHVTDPPTPSQRASRALNTWARAGSRLSISSYADFLAGSVCFYMSATRGRCLFGRRTVSTCLSLPKKKTPRSRRAGRNKRCPP
ncbi:hypothetical protein Bbelb_205530 [Branchiostoma belcheri]|nr:hypothetical protein Bbelb_205530 [Branchiostoma belcheri]